MRLDFNVLWVDDQPRAIDAQITPIKRRMQEEGFEFKPVICRSLDEVMSKLGQGVFNDEIDLILADWDLGGGTHGQDAIAVIRDAIPYKDVVFYSAATSAVDLRRLAFDNELEGIFCATRDGLVGEVLGVFESLVKKVLDLDHTRGIVMGATSDIDHMVHECLVAVHGKLQDADQNAMVQEALGIIEGRFTELRTKLDGLKQAAKMADLFDEHMIFTANDRLRVLARALESDHFKVHARVRDSVVKYQQEVVPKRNTLGHKVLLPDGKPEGIAMVGGAVIKLSDMRDLRKLILQLRSDFRALHGLLGGDP